MQPKSKIDCVIDGIAIIRKYQPNPDISAQNEVIYCGKYNRDDMEEGDRNLMYVWGWREERESWRIYV